MFPTDTNVNRINAFRMEKFLKDVVSRLDSDPESVIDDLKEVGECSMIFKL